MRKRERENLAEEIRKVADVLHAHLKTAHENGIEVRGPWHSITEWHELERIRIQITYPTQEEL